MDTEKVLDSLQKRKNSLKFKLMHSRLNIPSVLNQYSKYGSFFKASSIVGLTQNEIMNWYIQGQLGNPKFRGFFLAVNEINKSDAKNKKEDKKRGIFH